MGQGLQRARAAAKATREPSPLARAAKAIRADIKAAVRDGSLPPHPDGITFRVRSRRASLMTAIDIDIDNVPRSWAYTSDADRVHRPTPANLELREALRQIAARHYQADSQGSFITTDIHLAEED